MTRHGADSLAASQIFLGELDASADLAVTVLIRADDTEMAALGESLLLLAGAGPLGIAAPHRRILSIAGMSGWASAGRAGPIEVLHGDRTLLLRWDHRAGDAWTIQQLLLAAGRHSGLVPDGTWCDCAGWLSWLAADRRHAVDRRRAADRPHWATFRSAAGAMPDARRPMRVARAGATLTGPLLRRTRPRLGTPPPGAGLLESGAGEAGRRVIDESAIVAVPRPTGDEAASTFSVLAARAMDALIDSGLIEPGRRGARLGVTVDVRRHEPALAGAGAGNLSALGYVQTPDPRSGRASAAEIHRAVQALLASRFWLTYAAADQLISRASAVAPAASRAVIALLRIAPVTMTEVWTASDRPCARCDAPMAPTPPEWEVMVIPPAMPNGGITIGLTRRSTGSHMVALRASRRGDARRLPMLERAGGAVGEVISAGPTVLA